jgi:hypothetical protein
MPKFHIEQIAIAPQDVVLAKALLADLGMNGWVEDQVEAVGTVYGEDARNTANLSFCYAQQNSFYEFEIISYKKGKSWIEDNEPCVSHFGMHTTEEKLEEFAAVFKKYNILIAQEVYTESHTNPDIAGKRRYHYVIYETYPILGVDLKFIIRQDVNLKIAS